MGATASRETTEGRVRSLLGFALVSGIGLALDIGLFALLEAAGMRPGFANLISAGVAVTFVYFVSTRQVFDYRGRFLLPLFAAYLVYQFAAVSLASWAVDALALTGLAPILAKLAILPATFTANYLFMSFITRSRPQ